MYLQRIWLAFLCLHRQLSVSNGGMCREEKSQLGFALLNSSYSTKQTSHYSDCVYICALDPQCMSFNFWWEKKICDLNSKAREHSCRACFVTDKSSTYMGMARYSGYPALARSCSALKQIDPAAQTGLYITDPDGEGGFPPLFNVTCDMSDKNGVGVTVIGHDSETRMLVKGCNGPGCYSRDVHYTGASLSQLANLAKVSLHCEQYIKYECQSSSIVWQNRTFAWWVSRDDIKMNYWGGASPGKGDQICACGMNNTCPKSDIVCNCDNNDGVLREDSGLLTDKKSLPVKQLRFGDTGEEHERGFHTLGKFKCYGIV